MTNEELYLNVLERLQDIDYIKSGQIPDIELYMDQVTTFMDSRLANQKRYPDEKILTKTMINNYAKNRLLPSPNKKKYSREHLILLIFIYYMKDFLSFRDIEEIFRPITAKYFSNADGLQLVDLYDEVCRIAKIDYSSITEDFMKKSSALSDMFPDEPEEDRELLQRFLLICELSFDVYIKKQVIEMLTDDLAEETTKRKNAAKSPKSAGGRQAAGVAASDTAAASSADATGLTDTESETESEEEEAGI